VTRWLPVQPDEAAGLKEFVNRAWDEEIVPALTNYIAIPAKSPMFDPDWAQHGYIDRVIHDAARWVEGRGVAGLRLEIVRLEGRTPVIFFEVPATRPGGFEADAGTICLYGHLDKQPEFNGWRKDLGPWTPKYIDGLLYGRGGADDGYAVYAAITAIMALDRQGIARQRCVGIIESCEESGSFDLPAYIDVLKPRLGNVSLVVCLDSGAGNYDQLWLTTSLRGMVSGVLKVEDPDRRRALGRFERPRAVELPDPAPCARPARRQRHRRVAAAEFPLRDPGRAHRADARDRAAPRRRGLEALPVGLAVPTVVPRCPPPPTRRRRCSTALEANAQRDRRRRFPRACIGRQRAASVHRVQAQPAPAAAGRGPRIGGQAEGPARRQRAVQRPGHVRARWPRRRVGRDRLERAGLKHCCG